MYLYSRINRAHLITYVHTRRRSRMPQTKTFYPTCHVMPLTRLVPTKKKTNKIVKKGRGKKTTKRPATIKKAEGGGRRRSGTPLKTKQKKEKKTKEKKTKMVESQTPQEYKCEKCGAVFTDPEML